MVNSPASTSLPAQDASPAPLAEGSAVRSGPLRFLLPSIADLLFVLLFAAFTYGVLAPRLLWDADTGWHIRNGGFILATWSVPRVDSFSYTMGGQSWYAWEWLHDVLIASVHAYAGLNGVVLFGAFLMALTFTLLFRVTLARSRHLLVSVVLLLLALAASSIHFLARPHLFSWLFTVIWWQVLDQQPRQPGGTGATWDRRWWLPLLMLAWVNLHGGFILGLALLGLYLAGEVCTWLVTRDPGRRQLAKQSAGRLAWISVLSALATLANPYGYKLWVHVYGYLSNRFLMDHIEEFLSPNFHGAAERSFVLLLLLAIAAVAVRRGRLQAPQLLVFLFTIYTGLYAARNIPISSFLLALIAAPLLGEIAAQAPGKEGISPGIRRLFSRLHGFATRMGRMDSGLRGHLWPALLLLASLAIAFHGGRLGSRSLLNARFDRTRFPVAATDFLAASGVRQGVFSLDRWGGYLIYRLGPQFKVFIDDRHDFYGEPFVKDYLKVRDVQSEWQPVLDKWQINWVMVPPDTVLCSVLKELPQWRVVHDDGVAIVFARAAVLPR